jgi:flagellar motility protein MotE (MotC chaperone)
MVISWRRNKWVRFFFWVVVMVILLGFLIGLTLLLLDSLNIIDVEALREDWHQRLRPGSGEKEFSQEPEKVDLLEKEIAELKGENTSLRGELAEKSRELLGLLQELEEVREKLRELEEEKQRRVHIGEVYGKMRPQEAAAILGRLSDGEAVEILMALEAEQAGQILAKMDPGKAAALTKAMNCPKGGD